MKQKIIDTIDQNRALLLDVSHYIHENPELLFEEAKAAERLAHELQQFGFEVRSGVAGLKTAFRASLRSAKPGPSIAFLAEYDALPEIGHACGHNIIGAAALGAAIGLHNLMDEIPGEIVVFGTPAEEGGGGKIIMVDKGEFSSIDAAMIVHPSSLTKVEMRALAALPLKMVFRGKPAHAAGSPHEGINALDALINTFVNINALRQHLTSDVRIHGIITKGGTAPNIVPELAEGSFIIRAADKKYHEQVVEKVKNCAKAGALATGASVEFVTAGLVYDPMKHNFALGEAFRSNLEQLGWQESSVEKSGSGSTDMGNVSQVVPSIHPSMAICDLGIPGHSHEFRDAARSARGDESLLAASKAMALTAYDLLTQPDLLEQVKREFAAS